MIVLAVPAISSSGEVGGGVCGPGVRTGQGPLVRRHGGQEHHRARVQKQRPPAEPRYDPFTEPCRAGRMEGEIQ